MCGDFASGNIDSSNPPQRVCEWVWDDVRVCVCVCAMVFKDNIRISHFSLCGCSDPLLCVPFKSLSVPLWVSAISFLISQFWHSIHTVNVGLTFKQEVLMWRGLCSQIVENNKCICCSETDVKLKITPRKGGQCVSQRPSQADSPGTEWLLFVVCFLT